MLLFFFLFKALIVNGLQSLESNLYKNIFEDNNQLIERIPLKDGPVQVQHRLRIDKVQGVHLDEQIVEVFVHLSLKWKHQLPWNHSEFHLKHLSVDPEKIWQPGLVLLEDNSPGIYRASKLDGIAILFHNGTTAVDFAKKINFSCKMSSCLFPDDNHICNITLAIISHNASEAVFLLDNNSLVTASPNPDNDLWSIKIGNPSPSMANILAYPDWKTSMIKRSIELKRKPSFYRINIVIPTILIFIITIFAVILPMESGEKVTLLITCFLVQMVYLDVLLKLFPKTSNYVPLMIGYTTSVLMFTVLQIALTCTTAYLAREVESERRSMLKHLVSICWCRLPRRKYQTDPKRIRNATGDQQQRDGQALSEIETLEMEGSNASIENVKANEVQEDVANTDHKNYKDLCVRLSYILDAISFSTTLLFFILVPFFLEMMMQKKIAPFCQR